MKKKIITITMIAIFTLIGCGGGGSSSKEAKELLQRILTLVGIPQNIVINVCQDNNANNLCESSEILAKLTIDKSDNLDDIWQKIEFDSTNTHWLNDIDPNKKLLLVMQDTDSVRYDDGKFALPFTINPNREVNATKELSILEAMVDANYLNSSEVVEVKKMNFVEKFYDALLKDLMKNFNTLKDKSLDSSTSILENIKFMANELRDRGISKALPDSVNACGDNETCVDEIIAEVFIDLEMNDSQAEIIAEEKNGKEESQGNSSQKAIDFADYLPKSSMTKNYTQYLDGDVYKYGATIFEHRDEITRSGDTISYKSSHNYRGNDNSWEIDEENSEMIITDNYIEFTDRNSYISRYGSFLLYPKINIIRNLNIKDISLQEELTEPWKSSVNCTIERKLTTFSHRDNSYSGDIIEEKCISISHALSDQDSRIPVSKNIYYNYYKKGVGIIAMIDDDCNKDIEIEEENVIYHIPQDSEGCSVNDMNYIYYVD